MARPPLAAFVRSPVVRVKVRVHPGAGRERLLWDGETLQVWVTAPAAKGAANRALTRVLADALGVPVSAVSLVVGARARDKVIEVAGLEAGRLTALAAGPAGEARSPTRATAPRRPGTSTPGSPGRS